MNVDIRDAVTVLTRVWNEYTTSMARARREFSLARLEGRMDAAQMFERELKGLEYDVDSLAFALDVLRGY